MGDPITTTMAAVSAVSKIGSGIASKSEANAKAEALRVQAYRKLFLAEEQSSEVLHKGERDARISRREGDLLLARQKTAFASAGVDISGTPVMVMNETEDLIQDEIFEIQRASKFRASQIMKEAQMGVESANKAASNLETAGDFALFSGFLDAGYSTVSLIDKNRDDTTLKAKKSEAEINNMFNRTVSYLRNRKHPSTPEDVLYESPEDSAIESVRLRGSARQLRISGA